MKKLIVWSVDALFTSDLAYAKTLPGFHEIMENALIVENIECVYPTLTYPCHASIITGEYPGTHGIIHNEKLCPQTNNCEWYWDYQDIKGKTVFDYIKEHGLKSAAINWPLTKNAPIDYLIPEIWGIQEEQDEAVLLACVSENVQSIVKKHLPLRSYREYPQMDEFVQACMLDIMKEDVDVVFVHQANLDHTRHVHGIQNDFVKQAIDQQDVWLQEIIHVLKQQGSYEDTMFMILGDHGQLDIKRNICLNSLLLKQGYLQVDEQGSITRCKAYVQSAGISAHVYVMDKTILPDIVSILQRCLADGLLSHIFEVDEVNALYHLKHNFEFVIEAADGYAFKNQIHDHLIEEMDISDYKTGMATHGHLPRRGDCPPCILHHATTRKGTIQGGRLIDEAATILELLEIQDVQLTGKSLL